MALNKLDKLANLENFDNNFYNKFQNIEAEIAVIGCLLWDNRNYEKIANNYENSVTFCQKSASEVIWGSQMVKIGFKGCQGTAKGRPSDQKVGPRRPKVAPRMAKGEPLEAKMVSKGPPGKHFGGRN